MNSCVKYYLFSYFSYHYICVGICLHVMWHQLLLMSTFCAGFCEGERNRGEKATSDPSTMCKPCQDQDQVKTQAFFSVQLCRKLPSVLFLCSNQEHKLRPLHWMKQRCHGEIS